MEVEDSELALEWRMENSNSGDKVRGPEYLHVYGSFGRKCMDVAYAKTIHTANSVEKLPRSFSFR